MAKIKILEALCGCGKSFYMIEYMKSRPNDKWIFVTPFLSECGNPDDPDPNKRVGRVQLQAPELNFQAPSLKSGNTNKQEHLKKLLKEGANVSMTHNLFMGISKEVLDLIVNKGYCLVIDETIEKVELHDVKNDTVQDIKQLIKFGLISVQSDGKLIWSGEKLNAYEEEWTLCDRGILYLHKDKLLIKRYSSLVYEQAKEVYVLTYMFHASPMRLWFQANGLQWDYMDATLRVTTKERKEQIRNLVFIEKDEEDLARFKQPRQNEYSSTWYKNTLSVDKSAVKTINSVNDRLYMRWYKRNGYKAPAIMYTCFKTYADEIAGKGCKKKTYEEPLRNFIAKNTRATNDHDDKKYLLYWVNVYPHALVKQYLDGLVGNVDGLDDDAYALSEMVQWVFRSALRHGEPITLFIASDRMRNLFTEWLETDE